MIIKYDIEIDNSAIVKNIDRITNLIFKLLPSREEGIEWELPLHNLILEIGGMASLLEDQTEIFSVLCKLEELTILKDNDDFLDFRKIIFECLAQMNGVKSCLA